MCCVLRNFCVSLSLDGSTSYISPSLHFVKITVYLYLSSMTPPVISSSVKDRMKDSASLSSDSASLSVDSTSLSLSSTTPRLSRSPRRLHVSLALLDDSASLSLSSMAHLVEESLHLSLRPVALLDKIKSKDRRIKRHEGSSKKRTVV
ncbi:hypothetical protein DY000_02015272 [Brassica cretica]|uniref:REJ domain-containing protein n=1 Tax=Brassica cretica TaxID=69181 RepID=A0ABQ7CMF7_BRACR|nr:hypothetical protein DY000_02015272 [Brassica cretica]